MILAIGKLDRRITIQQLIKSVGADYGEPVETWADWCEVWANVYHGGGREFAQAQQVNAEIDTQFQIRYVAGLQITMRIIFDGCTYDIFRIDEVGRKNRWNIWAKARRE